MFEYSTGVIKLTINTILTMAIIIRNGQMYDGDTPIRPEAGNPEHIAALKKANKAYEEAQHGVRTAIDADIHYDITFKCVCGEFVYASGDICSAEDDYKRRLLFTTATLRT